MPASFELVLQNLETLDLEFGFESSADSEIRKYWYSICPHYLMI